MLFCFIYFFVEDYLPFMQYSAAMKEIKAVHCQQKLKLLHRNALAAYSHELHKSKTAIIQYHKESEDITRGIKNDHYALESLTSLKFPKFDFTASFIIWKNNDLFCC